ncbi:MAG TPA: HXXEE domain-containing protein [Steroidobacteraceae bacterium]|jgi:hypothetical protein
MDAASRVKWTFGALVLAQAAHSTEESINRLWESFPPARFASSLASDNLERGFIALNIGIVVLGLACWLWPVRRQWAIAPPILWLWIVVETINGIVHPTWSVIQGGYTPGVVTAPLLLILALYLAKQVLASSAHAAAPRPG